MSKYLISYSCTTRYSAYLSSGVYELENVTQENLENIKGLICSGLEVDVLDIEILSFSKFYGE